MSLKKQREMMTEQALMIESILRGNQNISLQEISERCRMSITETEFILEQMVCCEMVRKISDERYKLTYE